MVSCFPGWQKLAFVFVSHAAFFVLHLQVGDWNVGPSNNIAVARIALPLNLPMPFLFPDNGCQPYFQEVSIVIT